MANLAASDVTYTMKTRRNLGNSRKLNRVQLAFGDGVKTYPAGGIPITIGSLGCPVTVESFNVVDQGTSGYEFQYDTANNKLIITQGPSHSHSLTLKNAAVADGATTRVNAGTNLLGANTGSDITVAGGGANGGVQATTIGANSEVTSLAIAAQTIIAVVFGW